MTLSLVLSGISGALDRLRGRSREKLASADAKSATATDRKPRPVASSIPWRPLTGPLAATNRRSRRPSARDRDDELFVDQSVFVDILRHLPSVPGEQRLGFLLGHRLRCPATDDTYVLVDAIWTSEEPLSERHGAHRFEAAHQRATEDAGRRGKMVVGWFHNHSTLMGVKLSEHDLRLHSQFFPEPWQCALLVVPHLRQPDGGFLQRGRADSYPGIEIIPFYEVVPSDPAKPWGALDTVVNWKNYWTPRQDVRLRAADPDAVPPKDPSPATGHEAWWSMEDEVEEEPWKPWLPAEPTTTSKPAPAARPTLPTPADPAPSTPLQPTLWEDPLPTAAEASPRSAEPAPKSAEPTLPKPPVEPVDPELLEAWTEPCEPRLTRALATSTELSSTQTWAELVVPSVARAWVEPAEPLLAQALNELPGISVADASIETAEPVLARALATAPGAQVGLSGERAGQTWADPTEPVLTRALTQPQEPARGQAWIEPFAGIVTAEQSQPAAPTSGLPVEPIEPSQTGETVSQIIVDVRGVVTDRGLPEDRDLPGDREPREDQSLTPPEASPLRPAREVPESPALIYADTPVVIPPAESWDQRFWSLRLTLRRRAPWLAAILAAGVGGFLLLGRLGNPDVLEAPAVFHPAVGPPESAATTPAEFEALEERLANGLAAYRERRRDFDRGRIGCAGLSVGLVKVRQPFQEFSDYAVRHEIELPPETRVAQRRLGSEIADAKQHFETAGCVTSATER